MNRQYPCGVSEQAERKSTLVTGSPVPTRFEQGEFNAFLQAGSTGPARDDDSPVLMGANGRRATPEELLALVEELWAIDRAGSGDS